LRCVVALSGGLDSVVLLHALAEARSTPSSRISLRAVHVDHHLQEASGRFRRFCRRLARDLDVPLAVRDIQVQPRRGGSVEEAARVARYDALRSQLQSGELLLTAQHADDQLETVLLALLRGAGPAGLAAMPAVATFGAGKLLRPLLDVSRAQLASYATAAALEWVEDPTNEQQRFDRNYLRAAVIPRLKERWPSVAQTVARSARHCHEAAVQTGLRAARDLDLAADGAGLEAAVLRRWDAVRQKAVLRAWVSRAGLRSPDERRLEEALRMLSARPDAAPVLSWPGARMRRVGGRLTLDAQVDANAALVQGLSKDWDWRQSSLAMPGRGRLSVSTDRHGDLDLDLLPPQISVVCLGAGKERGGRPLRKLLQELKVPARERGDLPLLYGRSKDRRGPLLAVGDLWLAESLRSSAATRRPGRIVWQDTR
jgi:tRNA(Ile)-lysidine synthase